MKCEDYAGMTQLYLNGVNALADDFYKVLGLSEYFEGVEEDYAAEIVEEGLERDLLQDRITLTDVFRDIVISNYFHKFMVTLGINKVEGLRNSFGKAGVYEKTMDDFGVVHNFRIRREYSLPKEKQAGEGIYRREDGTWGYNFKSNNIKVNGVPTYFDFSLIEKLCVLHNLIDNEDWFKLHILYSGIDALIQEQFEMRNKIPGMLKETDKDGLITGVEFNPEAGIKTPFENQPCREDDEEKFRDDLMLTYHDFVHSGLIKDPRSGIEKWLEIQ